MPRPRFHKLPELQQNAIVDAALEEFATHGYRDASLNHIIATAGISKGSMYYYFDGKEDLYAFVAKDALERLFADLGPFPAPTTTDPTVFWSTLERYYLTVMRALAGSPQLAALARGWVAASQSPKFQQAQREMERAMLPWLQEALTAGQRAKAIRSDVPSTLLIAIVLGMGQAMDTWLVNQQSNLDNLPAVIGELTSMIRGAVAPEREGS